MAAPSNNDDEPAPTTLQGVPEDGGYEENSFFVDPHSGLQTRGAMSMPHPADFVVRGSQRHLSIVDQEIASGRDGAASSRLGNSMRLAPVRTVSFDDATDTDRAMTDNPLRQIREASKGVAKATFQGVKWTFQGFLEGGYLATLFDPRFPEEELEEEFEDALEEYEPDERKAEPKEEEEESEEGLLLPHDAAPERTEEEGPPRRWRCLRWLPRFPNSLYLTYLAMCHADTLLKVQNIVLYIFLHSKGWATQDNIFFFTFANTVESQGLPVVFAPLLGLLSTWFSFRQIQVFSSLLGVVGYVVCAFTGNKLVFAIFFALVTVQAQSMRGLQFGYIAAITTESNRSIAMALRVVTVPLSLALAPAVVFIAGKIAPKVGPPAPAPAPAPGEESHGRELGCHRHDHDDDDSFIPSPEGLVEFAYDYSYTSSGSSPSSAAGGPFIDGNAKIDQDTATFLLAALMSFGVAFIFVVFFRDDSLHRAPHAPKKPTIEDGAKEGNGDLHAPLLVKKKKESLIRQLFAHLPKNGDDQFVLFMMCMVGPLSCIPIQVYLTIFQPTMVQIFGFTHKSLSLVTLGAAPFGFLFPVVLALLAKNFRDRTTLGIVLLISFLGQVLYCAPLFDCHILAFQPIIGFFLEDACLAGIQVFSTALTSKKLRGVENQGTALGLIAASVAIAPVVGGFISTPIFNHLFENWSMLLVAIPTVVAYVSIRVPCVHSLLYTHMYKIGHHKKHGQSHS